MIRCSCLCSFRLLQYVSNAPQQKKKGKQLTSFLLGYISLQEEFQVCIVPVMTFA